MKKEILHQIINQINKYNLSDSFENTETFENWLFKLNKTEINNFINLNINPEDIKDISCVFITKSNLS